MSERTMTQEELDNALLEAASKGSLADVAKFLALGAKIEAASRDGWRALHLAVWDNRRDVVEFLLDRGARIDAEGGYKYQPLHIAAGARTFPRTESGAPPPWAASQPLVETWGRPAPTARPDFREMVKLLLGRGAKVDAPAMEGMQPLHVAAGSCCHEVAELLIEHGAQVDAGGDEDRRMCPLHWAAMKRCADVAKVLLAHGARVDVVHKGGWQPLHWAAANDARDVAGLLVAQGAQLDEASGDDGRTPLHQAVRHGHERMVRALLEHGADPMAVDGQGKTPRDICRYADIQAILEEGERKWNEPAVREAREKRDLARAIPALLARHRKLGALRPKGPAL